MTDIRCKECNELNDRNAIKCENCKASLSDACSSEIDECENDYRFIEEAELKGEVYKLENVDDENVFLEFFPVAGGNGDFKIEEIVEDSFNTIEYGPILNGNINKDDAFNIEPKAIAKSLNIESNGTSNDEVLLYQCNKCSKSFKRRATLNAHVNKDHTRNEMSISFGTLAYENKSKIESDPKPNTSPTFSDSCDSEYTPPEDDLHCTEEMVRSNSPLKTKRKIEPISEDSDFENNNSRKKRSTICKMSTSGIQGFFESKQKRPDLKRHMVYKCTACEKITNNYKEHIKHIIIHEAPVDSLTQTTSLEKLKKTPSGFIKCEECEGLFMSQREYALHVKLHNGAKVFQCDICKVVLVSQSSLRKHKIRVHKRKPGKTERQFECVVCNQKFPSQILMVHHRKTHTDAIKKIEEMTIIDRDGGKTIYVCKVCAKTSKNKYRHEEHLRIHTKEKPYKCEQCGTRISTANALVHHLRLHENDRPFKCDICEATYRHKKSLKKHLRLHTGEKPFKCRYCEKTFAFNYTRADHERNCHMGNPKIGKRRGRPIGDAQRVSETELPGDISVTVSAIEVRSINKLEAV